MKWYQEATINGREMPVQRNKDTSQSRWGRFVKPLLPKGGGLLVDLGCNAGFYMRRAKGLGYSAIGVEINDEYVEQARYWEKNDPVGITIIKGDINKYDIPACQVVLLANVHYWLDKGQLKRLVAKLEKKALSVLVVGRNRRSSKHKYPCGIEPLRSLFSNFDEGEYIAGSKHYSVIFNNPNLIEKATEDVFNSQPGLKSKRFVRSFNKLIDGDTSDYYDYIKWRGPGNLKKMNKRVAKKVALVKDVKKNGITKPLLLGRVVKGEYNKHRLSDGTHRLMIAERFGIEKIICRRVG